MIIPCRLLWIYTLPSANSLNAERPNTLLRYQQFAKDGKLMLTSAQCSSLQLIPKRRR
jgi:hypothetical protein